MKKRTKGILIVLGILLLAALLFGWMVRRNFYPAAPVPVSAGIKVACVGDSITQGIGVEDPAENAYPAQLQRLLGDEYQVLNYGLSGRSLQTDAVLSYVKEDFYAQSQAAQPAIVLIMLGTNDTMPHNWNADRYERDLEAFVRGYQALDSAPTVYLLKCPPIYSASLHSAKILTNEVIPTIERVAARTGVEMIDIFSALSGHAELFPDGLHPSAEGASIIAETVYGALL